MQSVFDYVWVFDCQGSRNKIVVASDYDYDYDGMDFTLGDDAIIFTDDFSSVEYMTD